MSSTTSSMNINNSICFDLSSGIEISSLFFPLIFKVDNQVSEKACLEVTKVAQDHSFEISEFLYGQEQGTKQTKIKRGKRRKYKVINTVADEDLDEDLVEDINDKYLKQIGKSRMSVGSRKRVGKNPSLNKKNVVKEQRARKKRTFNRNIENAAKHIWEPIPHIMEEYECLKQCVMMNVQKGERHLEIDETSSEGIQDRHYKEMQDKEKIIRYYEEMSEELNKYYKEMQDKEEEERFREYEEIREERRLEEEEERFRDYEEIREERLEREREIEKESCDIFISFS
jgi:hypothetical protein